MWKQSVHSSVISARLASKFLREGGLLVMTGAKAALSGTAGMIGYGMAKAAVHQLTKSLASQGSGMPKDSKVLCIMPYDFYCRILLYFSIKGDPGYSC